jgi:hypothetical protein
MSLLPFLRKYPEGKISSAHHSTAKHPAPVTKKAWPPPVESIRRFRDNGGAEVSNEGGHAMYKFCVVTLALFAMLICLASCASEPAPPASESVAPVAVSSDPMPPIEDGPGFVTIFDGKTFEGWKAADMSFWSVEDGAITAKITPEHPTERNHYLVYQGGKLGDFELKLRHRILAAQDVNCGFQFRSEIFDGDITDDCRGYQVDNNTGTPWLVRLYDEHGRETLAWRGERAVFAADGQKTVTPIEDAAGPARFKLDEWHECDLLCVGPKLTLKVNGRVVAEATDNDPAQQDLSGILALQLHSGPPMTVQFKDIRLKRLDGR